MQLNSCRVRIPENLRRTKNFPGSIIQSFRPRRKVSTLSRRNDIYLEVDLSLVDPSDDHVGAGHASVPAKSEADVAQRPDLEFERDVLGTRSQGPQQPVVRTEHRRVRPSGTVGATH